jgi:hypothetical protein
MPYKDCMEVTHMDEGTITLARLAAARCRREHRRYLRAVWGARLVAALTIAALAGVLYVAAEGSVRAATDLLLRYHLLG